MDQIGGTTKPEITVMSPVLQAVNLAKSECKEQKVNKDATAGFKPTRQTAKPKHYQDK